MSNHQCAVVVGGVRCDQTIVLSEPASPSFRFICRHHPDSVQRAAAGNTTPKRPDVRFQETQFDKDMRRAAKPIGTLHIDRQGSDTDDNPDDTESPVL